MVWWPDFGLKGIYANALVWSAPFLLFLLSCLSLMLHSCPFCLSFLYCLQTQNWTSHTIRAPDSRRRHGRHWRWALVPWQWWIPLQAAWFTWEHESPFSGLNSSRTHCEVMDGSHSRSVTKILTAYSSKKTYFRPGARKTEIHSFPTMYIMGGVRLVEMGQNSDCLKKSA